MKNEKPIKKSTKALIRRIENQIQEGYKLQADYTAAKKNNPGLKIDFLEDHTPSPPPDKTGLWDLMEKDTTKSL